MVSECVTLAMTAGNKRDYGYQMMYPSFTDSMPSFNRIREFFSNNGSL